MSGAVVQVSPHALPINEVTLSSPHNNPKLIMGTYFYGFNLRFEIEEIKSDP